VTDTEPTMLAPALATGSLTRDELATIVTHAAANTAKLMPPLAAKWMARELRDLANGITIAEFMWWKRLENWVPRIDEINAYAHRATRIVEHEVFLAGDSPDTAQFTAACDTLDDALGAEQWLAGAGAAHRDVLRLYGPWEIDKPAQRTEAVA
jgi:hypothetical protein